MKVPATASAAAATIGLLLLASSTAARASGDDGSPAVAKPKNDAPKQKHLLGDWGGLRTDLADKGVDVTFDYRGEAGAVVSGGKRHGVDYAQQLELKVDADWGKSAGIQGLETHVVFINRAGRNASTDYAGDDLFQIQEIYGGTHHAAIHLVEAYAQLKLAAGKVDLAGGRLPVGEDFATSPLYCDFMNTAICGYPHSLPAKVGFSAYPNSTWGARLRLSPGKHLYVQGGVYQVRPKFGGKYGFDWGFSGTTGTYLPVEAGWEPEFGKDALPGHYKAGYAYDTSDYDDKYLDVAGRPFVLSGAPPRKHSGRHSFYLLGDQMIARHGEGGENGLILLGGYVHSAPSTSQLSAFAFAGLVDQGLLPGRPHDSAGLIVASARISPPLQATEQLEATLGLPLEAGAPGVQSRETILEARYSIAAAPGVELMPDVQYLIHPSASRRYRNALALGLRLSANF
jgi:porin